jgi:branched-chain amino acid transport system substrate-binding protein
MSKSAEVLFGEDGAVPDDLEVSWSIKNTEGDPDSALSSAREFVEQEDVDVLAGTAISNVGSAVANYASNQNVPYVPTIPVSVSLTGSDCRRTTFRLVPHTGQTSRAAGRWAAENLGQDSYMVLPDYNYGQTVDRNQSAAVESSGGSVVKRSTLPVGHSEWGSVIDDINSTAPDYVFLEMTSTGVISFLAQAANRGLSVPVAGQGLLPVLTGQLSADQVSNLPDLFYTGMRYHHQIDNQRNTDYVNGWESAHGGVPGVLAGMTYGGLEFLVEVLSAADDVSTDSFVDTAEGFTAETAVGTTEIRACDHQGATPLFIGRLTGVDEGAMRGEYELEDPVPTAELLRPCSETGCSFE